MLNRIIRMLKFRDFFHYKKIFNAVLALFFIFVFGNFIFAEPANAATEINAYFFWGEGCPHCEKEKEFLDYMQTKYRALNINDFEVYNSNNNAGMLKEIAGKLIVRVDGVPAVFIGDQAFIGYADFATPIQIENRIKECMMVDCPDSIAEVISSHNNQLDSDADANKTTILSKLTKTTGGLVFLAILGIFIVGFVAFRIKK